MSLTEQLQLLVKAKSQSDIASALKSVASLCSTNKITTEELFGALFKKIVTETGSTIEYFNNLAQKILNIFDVNGDGVISGDDVTWFKQHEMSSIVGASMKIVVVVNEIDSSKFKFTLTSKKLIDISYKIIIYSIFLPLVTNSEGFVNFINSDDGYMILAELLNYTYTTLTTSDAVANVAKEALLYFEKPASSWGCCTASTVKSEPIQPKTTDEVTNMAYTDLSKVLEQAKQKHS